MQGCAGRGLLKQGHPWTDRPEGAGTSRALPPPLASLEEEWLRVSRCCSQGARAPGFTCLVSTRVRMPHDRYVTRSARAGVPVCACCVVELQCACAVASVSLVPKQQCARASCYILGLVPAPAVGAE
ncbi:hypothetical protein NDU88_000267 [Pleurodeles waltl]|uniref:Uncharacterized protein n=1 Tax=Pleurodeles waltl TaxID=8319 RepID=A0AAV7P0D4_PLEWA|nr:hypothetical protein NDU88_000267 [Pleurodeles waltl]